MRFRPGEKATYRKINESQFIRFPIKGDLTTSAHKVYLIIQAELGGVDVLKDYKIPQQQYNVDKHMIFDRIKPLVRCIIDCKSDDCDAVSIRKALDLYRSLSAGFWEHSPSQLRQVPQLGPAALMRFVNGDVKTMSKLLSLEATDIERIMSRQPPYGTKMVNTLKDFPQLKIRAEFAGLETRKGVRCYVKVYVGYTNQKMPQWERKPLSVTCTAENSNGALVYFWHGSIRKLQGDLDFKFAAELTTVNDVITCYLACDEVIGTLQTFKVTPKVSESDFPTLPSFPNTTNSLATLDVTTVTTGEKGHLQKKNRNSDILLDMDEYDDDELPEMELVAALDRAEASNDSSRARHDNIDDFTDIEAWDDIFAEETRENTARNRNMAVPKLRPIDTKNEVSQSVQMENGKWACNHRCKDKETW